MMDQFNIPNKVKGDVKIFTSIDSNTTIYNSWQSWIKPKGATMVYILCIGGGGGGGGGFTRPSASAGGGAGGGACSSVSRLTIPAMFLPDQMYVHCGVGGPGGAAGAAGTAGSDSIVASYRPTGAIAVAPNIIIMANGNKPGGGAQGTAVGPGAGGSVPTVGAAQPWHSYGLFSSIVGIVGAAGGAQSGQQGATTTTWGGITLSPGAGGAGCTTTDYAGGPQTAVAAIGADQLYFPSTIAAGGTAGTGVAGQAGMNRLSVLPFSSGGAGGGSYNAGTAGAGGAGGLGSGGGGGGAGLTGGAGGRGGDGIVIIISQ